MSHNSSHSCHSSICNVWTCLQHEVEQRCGGTREPGALFMGGIPELPAFLMYKRQDLSELLQFILDVELGKGK